MSMTWQAPTNLPYAILKGGGVPFLRDRVQLKRAGVKEILDLSEFLGVGEQNIAKTVVYKADEKVIFAVVQGDHEVNETKLQNLLKILLYIKKLNNILKII